MVSINKLFPSKYLIADDLEGCVYTLEISKLAVETMGWGDRKDDKPVLYFKGAKKGLVLNRTNAFTIAKLYGKETDKWIGERIAIYPTVVVVGGEVHDTIRIRPYRPGQQPAAAASNEKSTSDNPY